MGKSGRSCLSIIACAGAPTDHEDLEPSESGASSDRRRWSFRKRSSRHRVLSNSVASESMPVVCSDKEGPETSCDISNAPLDPFVIEKIASPKNINDILRQPHGTMETNSVDPFHFCEDTLKPDPVVEESAATVIQAAIRGYLVRQEMKKLRSVIKLQSVARGHLVRRQAAGTLRCVQAVIKVQALVRARLVRQSVEKLTSEAMLDACWADSKKSQLLEKEISESKNKVSGYPSKKLLTSVFARQLLESTPKSKPIRIHSDRSRSESEWKWLERWMALPSPEVEQKGDLYLKPACKEQRKNRMHDSFDIVDEVCEAEMKSETVFADKIVLPMLNPPIADSVYDASDFEFQAPKPVVDEFFSSDCQEVYKDDVNHVKSENIKENSVLTTDEIAAKPASVVLYPDTSCDEPEGKVGHLCRTASSDSFDAEDKKFVFGTRKSCNPAFAAAQAKFEELSSAVALRSKSTNQDVSVGSRLENASLRPDSLKLDSCPKASAAHSEESVSHEAKFQTANSECGTEISISSTLDSPDRSEVEAGEIILELGALESKGSEAEVLKPSMDMKNISETEIMKPSKLEIVTENPTKQALDSVMDHVLEQDSLDINEENAIDQEVNRSTPGGSPRSHITIPESHGTPTSQLSVNNKTSKENNLHKRMQRSQVSGAKRSPNLDFNSGGRNSTENLPKDAKTGKRRSSFGMGMSDHVELEPRSSTSNSLPSYMQATESARAKLANSSPKSSPDVQRDSYARKRHSLPMGSGKQGSSPRMQRSSSQVQQSAKQNGNLPLHSAERRWQR